MRKIARAAVLTTFSTLLGFVSQAVNAQQIPTNNFKKLIGLVVACNALTSLGLPQEIVLAASPTRCDFKTEIPYIHKHQFGSSKFKGDVIFTSSNQVNANGRVVNVLSGNWRVGFTSSDYNQVDLQTRGSQFSMTRHMDGELTQTWIGTCGADGYVRGIVTDPTVGQGNFTIKFK